MSGELTHYYRLMPRIAPSSRYDAMLSGATWSGLPLGLTLLEWSDEAETVSSENLLQELQIAMENVVTTRNAP